jgi:hypothetical protein
VNLSSSSFDGIKIAALKKARQGMKFRQVNVDMAAKRLKKHKNNSNIPAIDWYTVYAK